MRWIAGIIVVCLFAVVVITVFSKYGDSFTPQLVQGTQNATPAVDTNNKGVQQPMQIDTKKTYQATLHTTAGDIVIDLNASKTPITVNNFVALAKQKFYDNTIFHRVIRDFMIQGGDPKGDGTGGPGYKFDDEPFEGSYTRGTVAMANSGPNTNGSQFFIMQKDTDLPKNYVIFGKVSKGMEVVDKIATLDVEMGADQALSKPKNPVKVTSVEISEK
jgi:cyclophilin family peptidyl-prolyl cis-trans isomerase